MTSVYWLEQNEADLPAADDWLCPSEMLRLAGMRFTKRRADWRLGRWTAKRVLALCLNLTDDHQTLAKLEIRSARSGAPEVFLGIAPTAVTISLSHRSSMAVCAAVLDSVSLGCDLERIEPHSDAFVEDYFVAEEQALVARSPAAGRSRLLALLWSAKESALKALHVGLRQDMRSVVVSFCDDSSSVAGWLPLRVDYAAAHALHGWYRYAGDFVKTLVSSPPSAPPNLLASPQNPAIPLADWTAKVG
jgi:4'-phosphopantetheinyl transferase